MAYYHKLQHYDEGDDGDRTRTPPTIQRSHTTYGLIIIAAILMLLIVLNVFQYTQPSRLSKEYPPEGRFAKTQDIDITWKRFFWHTEFSPATHTSSDHLWDRILPSHGFIAIDRQEAEKNGWPESMYLPSDRSKGVYLLEAYHQLHCLKIIRQTFWEAVEGRHYTHAPSMHMEHCFDALRQSTICNADNLPLYTFGDKTAGDGQIHRCRNWEQLRDYATANSACYRDSIHDILLGEHFGYCDDGDDGILGS